ncbi:MAG: helix-turn-helix domain-containing protein [Lachnospiraceae bacterium]|nr:helix-turn-helix domain-containing protein [Lachnospiraceae bacterium]
MIKTLNGIHETVEFEEYAPLLLYDNTDFEEYPNHWHRPVELLMPLKNNLRLECNNQDSYDLRVGDILIIGPGVLHHLYACEGERIIFQVDTPVLNVLKEMEYFSSLVHPTLLITPEEYPMVYDRIAGLMLEIKDESLSNRTLKYSSMFSKFIEIMILIARNASKSITFNDVKPNKQQEYMEKFMRICDYINSHFTEDLSLEETARMAGFSKFHFSRLFKEFTNTTFYKYVNIKRISYAEALLLDPDLNVTEVAVSSGFNSVSSFMRMFRLSNGCTPTEFKNMHNYNFFQSKEELKKNDPKE